MALNDILFVGDVHGSMKDIDISFTRAAQNGIDTIVQVGDFWAYGENELVKMKRVQERVYNNFGIKVKLHFIDGNHEDYRIINPHLEDTVEMSPGMLYYHPRGTVFDTHGVTIGCFGGAFSIDKQWRVPGKTWFDDETPTMSDIHRGLNNFKNSSIDVLITHDIPTYALAQVGYHDTKLDSEKSIQVREAIELLSTESKAPLIVHGHWHTFAHEKYSLETKYGDDFTVNVVSLDKNSNHGALVNIKDNGDTVSIVDDNK